MSRSTTTLCAVAVLLLSCLCSSVHADDSCEWGYDSDGGANSWGMICNGHFSQCLSGVQQSPIDIAHYTIENHPVSAADTLGVSLELPDLTTTLTHNGHTIVANTSGKGAKLVAQGRTYEVLQFHLHAPSEYFIDDEQFDIAIHFVASSVDDQSLAVGGLLFRAVSSDSAAHPLLTNLLQNIPTHPSNITQLALHQLSIRTKTQPYFSLLGSLTTPPCTENVTWFVWSDIDNCTVSQLAQLHAALGVPNARPIQALHRRPVILHQFGDANNSGNGSGDGSGNESSFPAGIFIPVVLLVGAGIFVYIQRKQKQAEATALTQFTPVFEITDQIQDEHKDQEEEADD